MASLVIADEDDARKQFLAKKEMYHQKQTSVDVKQFNDGKYRLQKLDTLIQNIYENKVLGRISENVAIKLIAKYEAEQKTLSAKIPPIH